MYVSAPTSSTEPISSTTNSGPCVGSVPAVTGRRFLAANVPAMASTGTIATGWALAADPKLQTLLRNVLHHFGVKPTQRP